MKQRYLVGERFPVKFLVHSTTGDPFQVRQAEWELYCYGEPENSGQCNIVEDGTDTYLEMTLEPKQKGTYSLVVTMAIGEYVFKRETGFEVDKPC